MIKDNQNYNDNVEPNTAFLNELKNKLPEYFNKDGEFDLEKFKDNLKSNDINELKDGYKMNFIGKDYARRQSGEIPTTVVVPDDKHNNTDGKNSKNLFFTGDNLDVLRHLQYSYSNSIDFIYIDPPYNTGSDDFVYPDSFEYTDDNLKTMFGMDDKQIDRLKSIQGKSSHSAWLTFMYPRLALSKRLLTDKGTIFISIDDNEVDNLKLLMNEIYGESSYITTMVWDRNHSSQSGIFKVYHEYVLAYGKNIKLVKTPKSKNNDDFVAGALKKVDARHPLNTFTFPKGTRFDAQDGTELFGEWGGAEKVKIVSGHLKSQNGKLSEDVTLAAGFTQINQMKKYFKGEEVYDSRGQKIVEFYLNSAGKVKVIKQRGVETPATVQRFGTQSAASDALAKLFGSETSYFSSPKPVKMIKQFISWFTDEDSIVLDFFAGSSTTAQATMELNAEDGGNRKFIMVQLPEKTYKKNKKNNELVPKKGSKEAFEAGYKSIDEISRDRIKLSNKRIHEESNSVGNSFDGCFKHYRVVKPKYDLVEEIDKFNPNSITLFNDVISKLSSKSLNVGGNATGRDTILTTWLIKDGYFNNYRNDNVNFGEYSANVINDEALYLIQDGWTSDNTKNLLDMIGNYELKINKIIIFGYSFNVAEIKELEIGLKQLDINVNLLKRY